MRDPLSVCYEAIYKALNGAGIWQGRVYPDVADLTEGRPYIVFSYAAGGSLQWTRNPDAGFLIDVVCVAETLADGLTASSQITTALNNKGAKEGGTVAGDAEWQIQTVTLEEKVHFTEPILNNTVMLWHDGGRFRFIMGSL